MADTPYPIAIIGAGAVGLTLAARLTPALRVALITRDAAQADALRAGVQVGEAWLRADAYGAQTPPAADWVLVCVKAGATEAACAVARTMHARGVLSLQNGLLDDRVRAACAPVPAGQGITTLGAYREPAAGGGFRVVPAGDGEILVPPEFAPVAERLTDAGLRARAAPDIAQRRLMKWLVNLAINPSTAAFRVRNGALLAPPLREIVDALVREAWPVLQAEGLGLDLPDTREQVFQIASATGANRSSMLQDVLAGRPTELAALTGAFLALARRHGHPAPTHEALQALLQAPNTEGPREHTAPQTAPLQPAPR